MDKIDCNHSELTEQILELFPEQRRSEYNSWFNFWLKNNKTIPKENGIESTNVRALIVKINRQWWDTEENKRILEATKLKEFATMTSVRSASLYITSK